MIETKEAKKMKKEKTIELGVVDLSEAMAQAQIDHDNGVLRNVVLLTGGKPTKNNTFYTANALAEAGTRYIGAKMFLDHGEDAVRSVKDFGGVYKNVHLEGERVVGDLHLAENVKDLAISMAKLGAGGLSIRDRGRGKEEDGVFMVEGFAGKGPFSIDLVSEPSANLNLFEQLNLPLKEEEGIEIEVSNENKGGKDMKLSEVTLEQLAAENSALVEKIKADERELLTKEFEEKLKQGEAELSKAIASSKKLTLLTEAGFPAEVFASVRKAIEGEGVTVEIAEGIIATAKAVMESKSPAPAGQPKVKNNGIDQGVAESRSKEEEDELPSSSDLKEAIIA